MTVPALTPSALSRATLDPAVTFSVDADADAGNVVASLAALLIGIAQRRRERQAEGEDEHGEQNGHTVSETKDENR